MNKLLGRLALLLAALLCGTAHAQIYHVADMNAEQIAKLDKQMTAVLLPGGILEQHGPQLPSGTDGFSNAWLTDRLAESLVARPGWAVLVFPMIPLGHGAANELGGRYTAFGSYAVRRSTLRAVFMDLASELGEQGFKRVFIIHGHGSPHHNLALDQAGNYFRDTYGGSMVHLRGLQPSAELLTKLKVPAEEPAISADDDKENGAFDVHAGLEETSRLLYLRPDLVSPVYSSLKPLAANNPAEIFTVPHAANWPGYLGSPRLATAAFGAKLQQYRAVKDAALAHAILDGLDDRTIPRYANIMLGIKPLAEGIVGSDQYEAELERKQQEWLKRLGR
jgi:creatinine amidohydrolase/Fe(II)-dependent formamide hydrolase-like protein